MAAARYTRNQGYVVTKKRAASRATLRTTTRRFSVGPTAARFAGIAVLGVLAIILANFKISDSRSVYRDSTLHKQISNQEAEVERLNYEVARAKSIEQIQNTPIKDQMVPISEVGQVAGATTDKSQ